MAMSWSPWRPGLPPVAENDNVRIPRAYSEISLRAYRAVEAKGRRAAFHLVPGAPDLWLELQRVLQEEYPHAHPALARDLPARYAELGIGPRELRRRLRAGENPLSIAQEV